MLSFLLFCVCWIELFYVLFLLMMESKEILQPTTIKEELDALHTEIKESSEQLERPDQGNINLFLKIRDEMNKAVTLDDEGKRNLGGLEDKKAKYSITLNSNKDKVTAEKYETLEVHNDALRYTYRLGTDGSFRIRGVWWAIYNNQRIESTGKRQVDHYQRLEWTQPCRDVLKEIISIYWPATEVKEIGK